MLASNFDDVIEMLSSVATSWIFKERKKSRGFKLMKYLSYA